MKLRLFLLLFLFAEFVSAQTNVGLVAHYSFDGDFIDRTGNTSNTGVAVGTPSFVCGVEGQAILLDGANDQIRIPNTAGVAREFDREDLTISFYFKPVGFNGTQYLFSKRDTACANPRQLSFRYVPGSRTLSTILAQDEDKDVNIINLVNNQFCWQHLTVVRDDLRVKVYLNGVFLSSLGTASRIDLEGEGPIYIGGSDCIGGIETPFSGLIDEVRIYDRALDDDEVEGLYGAPDQIATNDTIIFQGNSVDIQLNNTCGTSFNWTPALNLMDPNDAEPTVDAVSPGNFTYYVQISDQVSSCIAVDSVRITVVDPNTLPCQAAMAKAFTPNRDNLNDTYGVSNPFALTDFISLEIFDRWGGVVFQTGDPFLKWDGTFKGEAVNPGLFLWRIAYRCDGEEKNETGTVTVMR